ncbi:YadA family autotransporter adhesin [Cupriavidus respiraculi]|nr:YadA-like family protein [Cupriavidus respiraculi]MBY4949533.1 YadA-like family protein [Cupriavidus respiraculi]
MAATCLLFAGGTSGATICLRNSDGTYDTLRTGGDTLYTGNGNQAGIVGGSISFTPEVGEGSGGTMNSFITGLGSGGMPLSVVQGGRSGMGVVGKGDTTLAQTSFGGGAGNPCGVGGANASNTAAMVADVQAMAEAVAATQGEIITNAPRSAAAALATGQNATAVGRGSVADRDNAVSMGVAGGERQITHVAPGTSGTDATNLAQMQAADAATLYKSRAYTDAKTAHVVRYDVDASGQPLHTVTLSDGDGVPMRLRNVAAGVAETDAANVGQVQAGDRQTLSDANRYTDWRTRNAIEYDVDAMGQRAGSVTLAGGGAGPVTIRNVAAAVTDNEAVNLAQMRAGDAATLDAGERYTDRRLRHVRLTSALDDAQAAGNESVAIGGNASASGANSVAIGTAAMAAQAGSVALGVDAHATAADSVALGNRAIASRGAEQYVDPISGQARRSAGEVSVGTSGAERQITHVADGHQASDAVNLRQLQSGLSSARGYVDERIAIYPGGSMPAPVATADNAVAIGPGSVADRANSVSVGAAGNARQLTNVAPGTAPTDAVTVQQLGAVSEQARRLVSASGAMSAAMAAMQPNARAEGPLSVSVGTGTYGGTAALAAGINYYASNRVLVNLKASAAVGSGLSGNQLFAVGAGATFGF